MKSATKMTFNFRNEVAGAFSLALASHLIASIVTGRASRQYFIAFVVALVALSILWSVILNILKSRATGSASRQGYDSYEAEIRRLPIEDARGRALELLENPQKFTVARVATLSHDEDLESLGLLTREFFLQYPRVESVRGEAEISRELIRRSRINNRYIAIGKDTDFTEIAVKRDRDEILELDGFEEGESDVHHYPSIYHWLLIVNWTLYPEEFRE